MFHNRDILIRADDSVVRVESSPGECFSTDNNPQHYPQKNSIPSASSPSRPNGTSAGIPSPSAKNLEGWGAGGGNLSSENVLPRESPPLHFFRRARGFVPRPLELPRDAGRCVLATGGELKNTLCLTRGKDAFLSQHVGDLKNLETFEFFQNMAEHLGGLLEVKPEAIVCDLHPDYLSTGYALDSGLPVLRLQHHFAHVYGVLAENGHDAPALGLALGRAPDTARTEPYGAENSSSSIPNPLARNAMADASAALRRSRCPGGEAAIREPWRIASGFMGLPEAEGLEGFAEDMDAFFGVDGKHAIHDAILEMVRRKATPMTSSCGRLFDAVSALLGLCPSITYEGQGRHPSGSASRSIGNNGRALLHQGAGRPSGT